MDKVQKLIKDMHHRLLCHDEIATLDAVVAGGNADDMHTLERGLAAERTKLVRKISVLQQQALSESESSADDSRGSSNSNSSSSNGSSTAAAAAAAAAAGDCNSDQYDDDDTGTVAATAVDGVTRDADMQDVSTNEHTSSSSNGVYAAAAAPALAVEQNEVQSDAITECLLQPPQGYIQQQQLDDVKHILSPADVYAARESSVVITSPQQQYQHQQQQQQQQYRQQQQQQQQQQCAATDDSLVKAEQKQQYVLSSDMDIVT
jgi:hypothetical protein